MDDYLRGLGLGGLIGSMKDCHDSLHERQQKEDLYYRTFSNSWTMPNWIASVPGLLRSVGVTVAAHRSSAHQVREKEV
jgi:hypothetical protein